MASTEGTVMRPNLNLKMSPLQQICSLDVYSEAHPYRMTNIICTVGPACCSVEILCKMIESGMNICRFNMGHGTYESHLETLHNLREAITKMRQNIHAEVASAVDITGPGIRIGRFKKDLVLPLKMVKGHKVTFTGDPNLEAECDAEQIFVDKSFIKRALVGNQIFIEDGPLSFDVVDKDEDTLQCVVQNSGEISSHHQTHIPMTLPTNDPKLTEQDKKDIAFAVEHHVDMVFVSWTWCPEVINAVRVELGEEAAKRVKVIAKIENYQGIRNLNEILEVADGIMVARGDLGIDIPPEKVFLVQKMIISRCNLAGIPVICAAQMLDSMVHNARSTRAEATDVANAILDGADCVMLSKETAIGKYPILAIETLNKICQEAENAMYHAQRFRDMRNNTPIPADNPRSTAIASVEAAFRCNATAIVVVTNSGKSASLIAQYRPHCIVIAITKSHHTARCLNLYRGVFAVLHTGVSCEEWYMDIDLRIHYALQLARKRGYVKTNDLAILVTGQQSGPGSTNTARCIVIPPPDHKPHYLNIPHTTQHLGIQDPPETEEWSVDDEEDF